MARAGRTAGWTALALLFAFALVSLYRFAERAATKDPAAGANRLVLVLLTAAISLLALGLLGVLVRNLVRLIVERKRGILGAKLRTKLVFFFLGFVLAPAFLLSYGAGTIIKETVEAILRWPVDEVSRAARQIAAEREDLMGRSCAVAAEALAWRLSLAEREGGPRPSLEDVIAEGGFDVGLVLEEGKPPLAALGPRAPGDVVTIARRAAEDLRADSDRIVFRKDLGGAVLFLGVARLGSAPARGLPRGVVVIGRYLGGADLAEIGRLDQGIEHFRSLRAQRRELLRLYYSLIAVIGLGTVFVATWIGFYLSRRITGPIEQLAQATREISAGNLGVRVRADAGDEVGMLVDAFNEMAAQLQESREVITRSARELRRSYEELDARRRYIETLVANLSTGVVSVGRDLRVATANPALERILGWKVRPGDELLAALEAAGLQPLAEFVRDCLRRPEAQARRDLSLSRGGEEIAVSVQLSPLTGGRDTELGHLLMVEDLTELLRAQRAAAWREVARRIAHEIKNPLTPIQLAAQRLRKKFAESAPDLPAVVAEATASIEREVRALQRLVDEFSRFARMPELRPEPVDFRTIVESVLALYRGHAGVRWEVESDPTLVPVRVDPEQMRRALINLVDNALAAMGGTGTVRIATSAPSGPGSLRIEVADTGPGIAPADRDKLFLPYFSTKRKGTGLGLAIVHRVVTDHRGTIRVEENVPTGARFVIDIPA
jgi:two-component system nitrogen regulation sensor histidine kinase NtrY